MSIHLTITADSVDEFDTLLARFMTPAQRVAAATTPEVAVSKAEQREVDAFNAAAPAEPAPKGNSRSRKSAAAAKDTEAATTASAGTAAPAESASNTSGSSESQATAGSTDAQSTGSAAVDPFATTATPAATSPADQAAADAGEVTIQQLKDAMADLLKAKSASFAMQTLEAATGCKSLTSGSPNVVEKAKDDPTIMRRTLDALVAAKAA